MPGEGALTTHHRDVSIRGVLFFKSVLNGMCFITKNLRRDTNIPAMSVVSAHASGARGTMYTGPADNARKRAPGSRPYIEKERKFLGSIPARGEENFGVRTRFL